MKLNPFTHNPDQPCKHMESLLNRAQDHKLSRVLDRFVRYHIRHCVGCQNFYSAIGVMIKNLKYSKTVPVDEEAIVRLSKVAKSAGETISPIHSQD